MYYFIPAWYRNNTWGTPTIEWYLSRPENQFDEIISQVRLFREAGKEAKLVVLNYFPQLRYFLHQQDLLELPYYSVFDEIQGFQPQGVRNIDYKTFNWPDGVTFVYTVFVILVLKDNRRYAKIEFGQDGNLTYITFYRKEGGWRLCYYFDDRGYLSSIVHYDENGQACYQDYLDQYGNWVIRHYLPDQDSSCRGKPGLPEPL